MFTGIIEAFGTVEKMEQEEERVIDQGDKSRMARLVTGLDLLKGISRQARDNKDSHTYC